MCCARARQVLATSSKEAKGVSVKTHIGELHKNGSGTTCPYLDLMDAQFTPHYEHTKDADAQNLRVHVASLYNEGNPPP